MLLALTISEDVFDPVTSRLGPSSPNLNSSSPNLAPSSPNLERNEESLVISSFHSLDFIDDLKQLSQSKRAALEELALTPRTKGKIPREEMIEAILNVCSGHYITLQALAEIVNRAPNGLRDQYLTKLRKERRLTLAFPDTPNDERQAYTTSSQAEFSSQP